MRLLVIILCALLLACIGGAAFFYLNFYQPLDAKMKTSIPEFDKAKAELVKYKSKEKMESAWMNPLLNTMNTELKDEILSGAIEALSTDNALAINIAEQSLYLPGSRTFSKESPRLLQKIVSLLQNQLAKGKNISIGNTTETVPAHKKGRIKIPQKDARALASERSMELVKHLEKKGVKSEALIAAAYASSQQTPGIKIKGHKTVIIIETPQNVSPAAKQPPVAKPQTKPTATTVSSATVTSPTVTSASSRKPQSLPTGTTKSSATPASKTTTTASASKTQPKPVPAPKTN